MQPLVRLIGATDSPGLRFIEGAPALGAGSSLTATVPNWLEFWLEAIVCSLLGLVQALEPGQLISSTAAADLLRKKGAVVNWKRNSTP
jgi:hypothetical protein